MKRRSLTDGKGKVFGQVEVDDKGRLTLSGDAAPLFEKMRKKLGDEKTGAILIKDGWSNGYARLGDVEEE